MDITHVQTQDAPTPAGHYSQAVVYNGLVFVAGQLSIDPRTVGLFRLVQSHDQGAARVVVHGEAGFGLQSRHPGSPQVPGGAADVEQRTRRGELAQGREHAGGSQGGFSTRRQALDQLDAQAPEGQLAGAGETDDPAAEHQDVRMGQPAASSAKAASKASRVAAISASP